MAKRDNLPHLDTAGELVKPLATGEEEDLPEVIEEQLEIVTGLWKTPVGEQYSFTGKQVTTIEVDPDKRLPDIDRSNNVWRGPGAGVTTAAPRTQ